MPVSSIRLRLAEPSDLPSLRPLVQHAIAELLPPVLSPEQVRASQEIMGLDTQLIGGGTYFVAELDSFVAGCGGWSRHATHFGGDHFAGRDPGSLDPAREPARVRAMYTHPDFSRRGIGRAILARCEMAAAAAGFRSIALVSTLAGLPLYRACGYEEVSHFDEKTPCGVLVPLVRMHRNL